MGAISIYIPQFWIFFIATIMPELLNQMTKMMVDNQWAMPQITNLFSELACRHAMPEGDWKVFRAMLLDIVFATVKKYSFVNCTCYTFGKRMELPSLDYCVVRALSKLRSQFISIHVKFCIECTYFYPKRCEMMEGFAKDMGKISMQDLPLHQQKLLHAGGILGLFNAGVPVSDFNKIQTYVDIHLKEEMAEYTVDFLETISDNMQDEQIKKLYIKAIQQSKAQYDEERYFAGY